MTEPLPRILVVEDSPTQAAALAMMLQEAGLAVDTVGTAEDAVERLQQDSSFNLVLTDVTLPVHSGFDLCRRLKRSLQPVNIPVIVLTGSGDVANVLKSLEAGADGYISKGRDPADVVAQIRKVLDSGPPAAPSLQRTIAFRGQQFDIAVDPQQLFNVMLAAFEDLSTFHEQHAALNERLEHELEQRKRAEKELRNSEAIYHSLVENVPVNLFRKDVDGRFTFANQPFCETLGVTPDAIVGKTDYDYFPKELADKYRDNDIQVTETGEVFEDVEAHHTPDGQKMWVHVLKAPVRDSDGHINGVQCVFWDVTDRKRAEEELQASQARKEAIFEGSLDCMVITDQDGKVTEFNRAAERTFGYRREEVLGKEINDLLFAPDTRSRSRENIADYATSRQEGSLLGKRVEVPLVRKNGEQFIAEMAMLPIPMGDTVQFATMLHDITERKSWERELQETKEAAEAANLAKSDFLANMSHEIRTPMNAIIGMTELVLDSQLPPEQHDHLKIVQDSAESLLDLINDILDFSKIEAGRLDLDRSRFPIRDRIGDTMKSLAVRAHEKDLELAYRIDPAVPDTVVGDAGRLRQVIVNLVGNAIKFTPRGEVVMDVRVESQSGDRVVLTISVSDTGIGISPQKQQSVFDAFEQVDASTTRRFGGTGLGLAISSRLVGLMGGRIWLESELDRGSKFYFTVELGVAEDAARRAAPQSLETVRGIRALIVDDNQTNRTIQEEMLTNWGLRTVTAVNGREGLQVLLDAADSSTPITLVISDVNMPEMDGFSLVEHIRAQPALAGLKLILLTSADRPGDLERCRQMHVDRYLTKPAKQSELLQAIESAMGMTVATTADVCEPERTTYGDQSLKILLAEDSPTNQILAIALLGREGHSVVVANNGREAVEKSAAEPFDLVLMDVQMPELDGLDATRQIRGREIETGQHVPIIAMTAHAMKGDRELCLEAGMDAYVSKPIRTEILFATLRTISQPPDALQESSDPVNECDIDLDSAKLVDWGAALSAVGGHRDVLKSVIDAVFEEVPGLVRQLEQAIQDQDYAVMQRVSHTINGALRTFAATAVIESATELEQLAGNGLLTDADAIFDRLCSQVDRTLDELGSFQASESIFDE